LRDYKNVQDRLVCTGIKKQMKIEYPTILVEDKTCRNAERVMFVYALTQS
jgi:hypothetical protein